MAVQNDDGVTAFLCTLPTSDLQRAEIVKVFAEDGSSFDQMGRSIIKSSCLYHGDSSN